MFMFLFLFFSVLLLCSFFILKELFQVKNGVTTSLLFFVLKMPNIWVSRMTVNGERKRGWPNLVLCLTKFVDTLLQPISKITEIIPFTEKTNVKNRTFLALMDVMSLDTCKYTAKRGYIEIVCHKAYENFYKDNPFLHITCRKCFD